MLFQSIGWIGISLILLAYFLITLGKVERSSKIYHLLNLTGSVLLIIDAYTKQATAFLVLNLAWSLIALTALLKRPTKKKTKK